MLVCTLVRLNKEPPNLYFKKKDKGGINLNTMVSPTCVCVCVCLCLLIHLISTLHSHSRFRSPRWIWTQSGPFLQNTGSTMLTSHCAVMQQPMTSLMWWRATGTTIQWFTAVLSDVTCCLCEYLSLQSLYPLYLSFEQNRSDLNRSELVCVLLCSCYVFIIV